MSSNQASWHDVLLTRGPDYIGVQGSIGGEHTEAYYIASPDSSAAIAQIVMCPTAVPPDAPPAENQAPNFHYGSAPIDTTQPQAVFDSSGICTQGGWTPGGVKGGFYQVGDRSGSPTGTPPELLNAKSTLEAAALNYAKLVSSK